MRLFPSDEALLSWLRDHQTNNEEIFEDLMDVATPIHYALYLDLETVVRRLLEKGADVNAKTKEEGTALHMATRKRHAAVARTLTEGPRLIPNICGG